MKIAMAIVAALIFFLWLNPRVAVADPGEDKLDRAGDVYGAAEAKAASDLTDAFDEQIKAVSQKRDSDAAQQLRAERAAFVSFTLVLTPNSAVMRTAVAKYHQATASAEAALRTAYESAALEYAIKHGMDQRFVPEADDGLQLPDPILDKQKLAWWDLGSPVSEAQGALSALVHAKAKAAEGRGDVDGYRHLMDILVSGVVPDDVTDPEIRDANQRCLEAARSAHDKLCLAYRSIIFELIKARRVDAAVAVREELGEGGWLGGRLRESAN